MVESVSDAIPIVEEEILRCIPDSRFVSLFGSFARGEIRPFSDIDVALDSDTQPDILTLGDAAGQIEARTGRPVDIVVVRGLAERDPELAYRIAAEGILIRERERFAFARFKKRAFLQYLDTEYLRRLNRRSLHRRIRNGTMGRRDYV